MGPRTAALLLRLPLRRESRMSRRALGTVLRAAVSGTPVATRAVARAIRSRGREAVWRAWLELPSRRWDSPALAELLEGAPSIPGEVIDAAWSDWLDEHAVTLWSLLERWACPATAPQRHSLSRLALGDDGVAVEAGVLAEAAVRFDHPIGERARARLLAGGHVEAVDLFCAASPGSPEAVGFCVAHHLAPSDDVERAVFFMLTGQYEQYRALDADGALLALGYRSASAEVRGSLRTAMTAFGGIDTLRVLAGGSRRDDLASLTEPERAYLVRQLADHGDRERLWSLTVLLPLAEAVDAAHALGDWRPAGTDDRRVFEALRGTDPHRVRALGEVPPARPLPAVRLRLGDLDERLSELTLKDLDFAPDGTQLAFAGNRDTTVGEIGCAGFVNLGGRPISGLYYHFPHPLAQVAHLGSDAIVVAESGWKAKIHYADRDGMRTPHFAATEICGLERIAGDRAFVVSATSAEDSMPTPMVFTGNFGESPATAETLHGLAPFLPEVTVVAPGSRLVGMLASYAVVVDLADSVVHQLDSGELDSDPPPAAPVLAALSPSALVSWGPHGGLRVWHEPLMSAERLETLPTWSAPAAPIGLAWSPALGRFLSLHKPYVEILDLAPAAPDRMRPTRIALAEPPPSAGASAGEPLATLSPAGDVLAVVTREHTIDVYPLTRLTLARLIAQPLGLMDHKALADVVAAQASPVLDDESRRTLDLIRACLEYRFRHDIGIGDAAETRFVADYDVELGG